MIKQNSFADKEFGRPCPRPSRPTRPDRPGVRCACNPQTDRGVAPVRPGAAPPVRVCRNPAVSSTVASACPQTAETPLMLKAVERELMDTWKTQDAVETYGVRHWSKGYFSVNSLGHVTVHP